MNIGQSLTVQMPLRIQSAFQALYFLQSSLHPPSTFDGMRADPRELSVDEEMLWEESIRVIKRYVTGELQLGDGTQCGIPPDDPGKPVSIPC